jgi:hypothetical protein
MCIVSMPAMTHRAVRQGRPRACKRAHRGASEPSCSTAAPSAAIRPRGSSCPRTAGVPQHEKVETFHLVAGPRRPAQKLQARCEARAAGEAAHGDALSQAIPAVVRDQRCDERLERHAVQRIAVSDRLRRMSGHAASLAAPDRMPLQYQRPVRVVEARTGPRRTPSGWEHAHPDRRATDRGLRLSHPVPVAAQDRPGRCRPGSPARQAGRRAAARPGGFRCMSGDSVMSTDVKAPTWTTTLQRACVPLPAEAVSRQPSCSLGDIVDHHLHRTVFQLRCRQTATT